MSRTRDDWTAAVTKGTLGASRMPQAKRSKYHAVKVTVDNIVFDSKAEAARYHELKLMEKAGLIEALELQPAYVLTVRNGERDVSVGLYRADFRYWQGGDVVVEDVKGMKTPVYQLKKKMVEAIYGIKIHEI